MMSGDDTSGTAGRRDRDELSPSDPLGQQLRHAAKGAGAPLPEAELAALWGRVRAETTAARPGWRVRLQELPTGMRVTIALASALLLAAVTMLVFGTRESLAAPGMLRVTLVLSGLALVAAASFAVSLRGVHQRPLRGWSWSVIGIAIAVPVGLALLPGGAPFAGSTELGCLAIGLGTGALVSVPVFLMQRATVPVLARACAALAGGGVVAYVVLELHCPSRDVTHLLVGHAAVGLVLVALSAAVVTARRA